MCLHASECWNNPGENHAGCGSMKGVSKAESHTPIVAMGIDFTQVPGTVLGSEATSQVGRRQQISKGTWNRVEHQRNGKKLDIRFRAERIMQDPPPPLTTTTSPESLKTLVLFPGLGWSFYFMSHLLHALQCSSAWSFLAWCAPSGSAFAILHDLDIVFGFSRITGDKDEDTSAGIITYPSRTRPSPYRYPAEPAPISYSVGM